MVQEYHSPEVDEFMRWGGERSNSYNAATYPDLVPIMTDPDLRIEQMNGMNVDIQAIAPCTPSP